MLIGIEYEPQLSIPSIQPPRPVFVRYGKSTQLIVEDSVVSLEFDDTLLCNEFLGIDLSVQNLEVRTKPVTLDSLQEAIQEAEIMLARFVANLSKEIGRDIGVFLPGQDEEEEKCTAPSKHINLSKEEWIAPLMCSGCGPYGIRFFPCVGPIHIKGSITCAYITWKSRESKVSYSDAICRVENGNGDGIPLRLHIEVPYNYTDYKGLVNLLASGGICNTCLTRTLRKWINKVQPQKKPIFVGYTRGGRFIRKEGLL